jgi:hypothetical protein
MLENELDVFCGRPLVAAHNMLGATTHFGCGLGVLQELLNLLAKLLGGGDFPDRIGAAQTVHHFRKIAGKRPDDDRLGHRRRLDHVASVLARAEIDERAAHEDDVGEAVELSQFAHGVAEDDRRNTVLVKLLSLIR